MKRKLLIFDLDGTLVDSSEAIISTIIYTLNTFGIHESDINILRSCIGPTLTEVYKERFHLTEHNLSKALTIHKERFKQNGVEKNIPYKGILEFLKQAKVHRNMAIATTKYTEDALAILKHTHLDFFDCILGADDSMIGSDKTHLLKKVIGRYPSIHNTEIIMIGDRKYDILAARNCNIDSIAVTWGFGSKKELEEVKPTFIASQVHELLGFI